MSYLFDGINHPTVKQVQDSGAVGCLMYGGTPGDSLGKDFTAVQYSSYKAGGLLTAFVFENTANDMSTGMAGGAAHADALLADLHGKGVLPTEPIGVTVDEHVTAANIPLAVQYQTGFYRRALALGWAGARGGYGFSEFLIAIHDALVCDWFWGAGSRASLPPYTNIWQDNTGTINVGGSADDRDWILVPLPIGGDMNLTDILPNGASVQDALMDGMTGQANRWTAGPTGGWLAAMLPAILDAVKAGTAQEASDHAADLTALSQEQAALLAAILPAIKAMPTGGQVDVTALATSLAPTLAKLLPQSTPAQIGAAVEQALAAQFAKP